MYASILALSLAGRPLDVQVPLSAAEPTRNSTYAAGASTWHLRTRRLGTLETDQPWLTCSVDGRWVVVDVAFNADSFPALPTTGVCSGTRADVKVTVTAPKRTARHARGDAE